MDRDELMQAAYDEYFSTGYDPTGGEIEGECEDNEEEYAAGKQEKNHSFLCYFEKKP